MSEFIAKTDFPKLIAEFGGIRSIKISAKDYSWRPVWIPEIYRETAGTEVALHIHDEAKAFEVYVPIVSHRYAAGYTVPMRRDGSVPLINLWWFPKVIAVGSNFPMVETSNRPIVIENPRKIGCEAHQLLDSEVHSILQSLLFPAKRCRKFPSSELASPPQ